MIHKEDVNMDDTPSTALPENEAEQAPQEQPGRLEGENTVVENSMALSVSAANNAKVENSMAAAFVAGNDLTAMNSAGAIFVAGNDVNLQQGGGAVMVVGNQAHFESSTIGILIPSGDVNLYGESKVLMTTQQALALGAGFGIVFALLTAFLRRLRG